MLDKTFVPDERKAEIRKRLARLKGQLEGVERMLDSNRPCAEILTQISAAQEALRGTGRVMARDDVDGLPDEYRQPGLRPTWLQPAS